jgi:hypothetical protein
MHKLSAFATVSVLAGLCAPWAANADDIVTLTYQGVPMTGTYESAVSGLPTADPFVTSPFTGTVTGSVVFDETLLAGGPVGPSSYSFTLTGSGSATGIDISFISAPATPLVFEDTNCYLGGNCISVSTTNGVITGANVGLLNNLFSAEPVQLSIGPQGDTASFVSTSCASGAAESPGPIYTGPTCTSFLTAANSTAGTWTVASTAAPEIDPAAAASALTLLAGWVAIVRGRKRAAA